MYMFYLVSAVALSTGVSTFVQYDTLARTKDATSKARIEVAAELQQMTAKKLRREFQMTPQAFPAVAPGGFTLLDTGLVEASLQGGYLNINTSSYYLSDQGEVIAIINAGVTSPLEGNGDEDLGINVSPQNVTGFLDWILGDDYVRGPGIQIDPIETVGGFLQPKVKTPSSFLSDLEISKMTSGQKATIAYLDLDSIDYNELAGGITQSPNVGLDDGGPASFVQVTYEVPEFSSIQDRLFTK